MKYDFPCQNRPSWKPDFWDKVHWKVYSSSSDLWKRTCDEVLNSFSILLKRLLLAGSRRTFFYLQVTTAWLYDLSSLIPPYLKPGGCFARLSICNRETVKCIEPITTQTLTMPHLYQVTIARKKITALNLGYGDPTLVNTQTLLEATPKIIQQKFEKCNWSNYVHSKRYWKSFKWRVH